MPEPVADLLATATSALPGGGEERPGQRQMAEAVAGAIERGRHLLVQAGTGTGKSLAYLVPAVASGRRVVVATATKALQDQLAGKDLPFLAGHLPLGFDWAVLKGRSNYLCLQRVREVTGSEVRLDESLEDTPAAVRAEVARLAAWAASTARAARARARKREADSVTPAVAAATSSS